MRAVTAPALLAILLAGCAHTRPVPTTVVTGGMPNPEVALRQSMQRVDAEMAELGTMQAPIRTAAAVEPVAPADLQRIVNFRFSGPLDRAVAKLALSIGYTFYTTVPPNAADIMVSVQVQGVPAVQVFRVLGDQAGTRATVQVDPLHHQVWVIHHV
jgi:defect in organelle trafficking protein DotD